MKSDLSILVNIPFLSSFRSGLIKSTSIPSSLSVASCSTILNSFFKKHQNTAPVIDLTSAPSFVNRQTISDWQALVSGALILTRTKNIIINTNIQTPFLDLLDVAEFLETDPTILRTIDSYFSKQDNLTLFHIDITRNGITVEKTVPIKMSSDITSILSCILDDNSKAKFMPFIIQKIRCSFIFMWKQLLATKMYKLLIRSMQLYAKNVESLGKEALSHLISSLKAEAAIDPNTAGLCIAALEMIIDLDYEDIDYNMHLAQRQEYIAEYFNEDDSIELVQFVSCSDKLFQAIRMCPKDIIVFDYEREDCVVRYI